MTRIARIDIANSWYHIITRGLNRQKLFLNEVDYITYLKILNAALERYDGYIGAYCLMTNPVPLLIYRREHPLEKIFHKTQSEYSRYFNKKYKRTGYLFQGRYKSKLVLSDKYLNALINYIHRNPVRAHIRANVKEYRWTSDLYYRSNYKKNFSRFRRIPGFEDNSGTDKYLDIINEPIAYPETESQYVGKKERQNEHRRKVIQRYQKERRGIVPLAERVDSITQGNPQLKNRLRGMSRKRDISHERKRIMAQLYEEGYGPGEIAHYFNRTPAAVIRAVERKNK